VVLQAVRDLARELKRPVFVGEFGLAAKDDPAVTLVTDGRSTPGAPQMNDVKVRRYPQKAAAPAKNAKTKML